MFKKLSFSSVVLSSLFFGGIVHASEISDVDTYKDKIAVISSDKEKLIDYKKDLLEDKRKEELILENVSKIISNKTPIKKGSLNNLTNNLKNNLPTKEILLEEESIDDKLNKLNISISVKENEIKGLEQNIIEIDNYERFLKSKLEGNSYNLSEMTKPDLENKLTSIKSKLNEIESYKIDVKDTNLKEKTVNELNQIVSNLETDIKNFKTNGQKVVEQAMTYLGVPYVWGGKSPSGMDCSGLTQLAYRNALGKEIGVWTVAQESSGSVSSVSDAEVGDLLFWGGHGSTYHVGIYIGDGKFIHAPQPGEVVKISNLTDFMPDFALKVI